jgi:hypothetical protein
LPVVDGLHEAADVLQCANESMGENPKFPCDNR